MDVSMSSVRLETVGAVKAALVSAENLHLSLKSGLSLEEQALTHTRSPEDTHNTRYWGGWGVGLGKSRFGFNQHYFTVSLCFDLLCRVKIENVVSPGMFV